MDTLAEFFGVWRVKFSRTPRSICDHHPRIKLTTAALVSGLLLTGVTTDFAIAKTPKPTKAQIDAAKAAEAAKQAAANAAASKLSAAQGTLRQLTAVRGCCASEICQRTRSS
jgi:hypothetical protein